MTCVEGDFPEAAVGENQYGKKTSTNTNLVTFIQQSPTDHVGKFVAGTVQ